MKILRLLGRFIKFNLKILYTMIFVFFIIIMFFSALLTSPEINIITNYDTVVFRMKNISDNKYKDNILFENKGTSFLDVILKLENIRQDDKIKNIVLDLDKIKVTDTQVDELLEVLEKYKISDKKILAYGTSINNTNYKLAVIADKIGMPDSVSTDFELKGYSYNKMYFKNLIETFGIEVEAIHTGDYK
ncbi:S49 family peptidase, partial [Oceanivirga salmonicida]